MWNVSSMYCAEWQWQQECREKFHPQHEDCLRHVFKWNTSVFCTLLSTELLVPYTGQRAAQCALHGENKVKTVKQRTCHRMLQISCITSTSIYTSWCLQLAFLSSGNFKFTKFNGVAKSVSVYIYSKPLL